MIKLIQYDDYSIYYSYNGVIIKGIKQGEDVFRFYFPVTKYLTTNFTYIIREYELLLFGEKMEKIANTKMKEEIEEVLKGELEDNLNQRVLMVMLFKGQLELE